jgi:Zn-dependent M28 family amino/carboxypeptidase
VKSKILKSIISIFLLLVLICSALVYLIKRPYYSVGVKDETSLHVDKKRLRDYVKELSESFLPRDSAHPQNLKLAADYIKSHFEQFNSNTDFQTYEIDGEQFSNVISNFGPDTDDIIIVGAHYDAYADHPGADDNASGVAGLIELGRLLSKQQLSKRIVLVAYTCEEPPHFASDKMGSFVHSRSITNKTVRLMISLEMIGYFTDEEKSQNFPIPFLRYLYPEQGNYIAVVGQLFSSDAGSLKNTINYYTDLDSYSINAPSFVQGVDFSDHRNYWDLNIPAVMVTDTAFFRNKEYHQSTDTYDRLDYESMAKVVYGVFKYVQRL